MRLQFLFKTWLISFRIKVLNGDINVHVRCWNKYSPHFKRMNFSRHMYRYFLKNFRIQNDKNYLFNYIIEQCRMVLLLKKILSETQTSLITATFLDFMCYKYTTRNMKMSRVLYMNQGIYITFCKWYVMDGCLVNFLIVFWQSIKYKWLIIHLYLCEYFGFYNIYFLSQYKSLVMWYLG